MAIKSSIKILIADDHHPSRQAACQLFHQLGLKKTSEAADGAMAWELLNQEDFGLILCELKISKQNAIELISAIKENPHLKNIPFIIMTADSNKEVILKANQLGVKGILVKPFSQQTLTDILVKIFN